MKFLLRALLALSLALPAALAQTSPSTLNLSTDLVRLGIAATDMTPNQPSLDSTVLFENAIKYIRSRPNVTLITANPGAYYFLSASTLNTGANVAIQSPGNTATLTIDFQGSDLYMNQPGKFGFALVGLANVVLQNFTLDSLQHLYTQVQVTSVNAAQRQIQYTAMPGWQKPTALQALDSAIGATSAFSTGVFIFRNGQSLVGSARLNVAIPHAYTDTGLTFASSVSTSLVSLIQPGDVALINSRGTLGGSMLYAQSLNNCTLRNIKIYDGTVGFRSITVSNSVFERIYVMPRPGTDRLLSVIAGGIVPATLGPNNTIRLCRVIRNCDDGFAPNTFVFGRVASAISATSVQVGNEANTTFPANNTLAAGTPVTFEQPDGTIIATATVVSVTAAPAINGVAQLIFNLNQPVPASAVGSYVYATDASLRGGMTLERNTVQRQAWGNGFALWGLLNTTFTGNYAYHTAWNGVSLIHAMSTEDWIVPATLNATISNNVIDGAVMLPDGNQQFAKLGGIVSANRNPANGQPFTTSPNQNVYVVGNFVANPSSTGIWLGNTNGGVADSNYVLNSNNNPNLSFSLAALRPFEVQPLVTLNSVNVSLGTNTVDSVSGQVAVTDTGFQQLAAYAPGSTIRLSGLNIGTLGGPSVSLTDADAKTWPLTIAATSTHSIDVQLPAGIALGGATVSLSSGSAKLFGTLFVDSQDNVRAINQATFQIAPVSGVVPAAGGTVSLLVVTQPGTPVTVTSADTFVTPGAAGSGTSVVTVTLAGNTGPARTATVQIAQQPVTINQAGATEPVIATQLQSQTIAHGADATWSVQANGAQSYQWFLNGNAVAGATNSTLTLKSVTAANGGTYTVQAKSASGATATGNGALLTITNTPSVSRLANLSILTNITTADRLFTLGTVVGGGGTVGSKALLIRAAGPALTALGVGGALTDPKLDVFSGQTVAASNDDWGGTSALSGAFAAVGAFGYGSATSKDAAVYNPALAAGGYTVQVSGVGTTTGTVIAELYDSTPSSQFTSLTPRLINVSVLKQFNAGETLTAGFVVSGSAPQQVLIRAVGPTLAGAPFNIGGAMADPKLDLFNSASALIGSNDNWGTPATATASTAAQLSAAFNRVGAFALTANSRDAAMLVTLAPGNYTAQVSGVNNTGGQAIVEVYEAP